MDYNDCWRYNHWGKCCSNTGRPCLLKEDSSDCSEFVLYPYPLPLDGNGRLPLHDKAGVTITDKPVLGPAGMPGAVYYKDGQWVASFCHNHYYLPQVFSESGDFRQVMKEGWIRISVWKDSSVYESHVKPTKDQCKTILRAFLNAGMVVSASYCIHASAYETPSCRDDDYYDAEDLW